MQCSAAFDEVSNGQLWRGPVIRSCLTFWKTTTITAALGSKKKMTCEQEQETVKSLFAALMRSPLRTFPNYRGAVLGTVYLTKMELSTLSPKLYTVPETDNQFY